jgi:hypothetical protein
MTKAHQKTEKSKNGKIKNRIRFFKKTNDVGFGKKLKIMRKRKKNEEIKSKKNDMKKSKKKKKREKR